MLAEKYVTAKMWDVLKENLPERSDAVLVLQVEEFLKFMTIASDEDTSFIPLNAEVDDIWHEFIMQTASYDNLCKKLPGKRFIHHETISMEEYSKKVGKEQMVDQMLEWLPKYINRFGPFTDKISDYWTICRFLKNELGLSLAQINNIGSKQAQEIPPPQSGEK